MSQWSILGIEPTDDISIIKKAYAQKLRIYHPEVDPEGYQNLRQAYDNAIKYAKYMKERYKKPSPENEDNKSMISDEQFSSYIKGSENEECENNISYSPHPINLSESILQKSPGIEEQNREFISKVEVLYNDFFSRIEIDKWKALLNTDVMWNISNKKTISKMMLDFLTSHHYLPKNIWGLLDNNFNWCDKENPTYQFYNNEFVNYIQMQLKQGNPLSYSFFKPIEGVDYERFLENREKAQVALLETNISAANLYIERAKKIYSDDPDLLRMEGEIHLRNGNIDEAISVFSKLLSINPNDTDALFYRAVAYYENSQIQKFIEDYSCVNPGVPVTKEIPLLMAKSYFKIGAMEKSKEWAQKAIKEKSSSNEAKTLLSQIYARLRNDLNKELEKDPSNKELKIRLDAINEEVFKNSKKYDRESFSIKKFFRKPHIALIMIFIIIFAMLFGLNQIMTPCLNSGIANQTISITSEVPVTISSQPGAAASGDLLELTDKNIEEISDNSKKIHVTLKDVIMLSLYLMKNGNTGGDELLKMQAQSTGDSITINGNSLGYFYIGKLGDKSVIFCASHPLTYKDSFTFSGYIYTNPPKEMMSSLMSELTKNGNAYKYKNIIASRYLLVKIPEIRNSDIDDKNSKNIERNTSY